MDQHSFPYNIRSGIPFFRDLFDMNIQNSHTLTVRWNLSVETMKLAETVLFEKTPDMIKEIRIFMKRNGIEAVRTKRIKRDKGKWIIVQVPGHALYRAEYRILNSMNVSLKLAETEDTLLAENGVSDINSFRNAEAHTRWEEQFSAYTCYRSEGREK
ncbi:hypothetical protein [Bacillus mojavensis]|uniref:hypothetical protein n=1 Tax=Bacillus mojavensis TaxID=72360 RepID=UPI002DBDAA97|nr:hypothetical protein [Bacillus mojavensis]MEC1753961.1 hypothetical protein [Bacillus mojavensis]